MELWYHWQIFRRHLPTIVMMSILGALAGVWLALSLPAVFKSQAVLIVESGQIPDELAASTVQTGEIEALQIIRQRILSREVLLEMANDLGIYPVGSGIGADAKVNDLRQRIEIMTRGGQVRRAARDATIVTVAFSADDPLLASRTANEVVTLILQENVEMRTSVARQTLDFFTQEVARFESSLREISNQILAFQENNIEALPDSLDFRRSQMASLQERLRQLEREQTALQDRRAQLIKLYEATGKTELANGNGLPRHVRARLLRPEEKKLSDLRAEAAQMSAVLSNDNPRMVLLRSQITAAEAVVAALPPLEEMATDPNAPEGVSLFEIQLSDLDAQIAYIVDQKVAADGRMAQISSTIEETPSNAATLQSLERTYANLQEQYNLAVSNKARAEQGSMIESLSRGQRITVVEQAVPPERPTSPNRPVIAIGGVVAGLLLSLTIAGLMELTNRSIRRPEDIQNALGVEVFATIPYMSTPMESVRSNMRRAALSTGLVGIVIAALWAINQTVQPLQPVLERFVGPLL